MKTAKLNIISALLLVVAMTFGANAWAQSFTIEASHDNGTNKTTFTITRSGNNLPEQTINYRTVNLSAFAEQHYTAVSGTFTFAANATSTSVQVQEKTATQVSDEKYRYQSGTTRSYRFEVLDVNGFELAYKTQSITYGSSYQFQTDKVSQNITDLVYFNNNGNYTSGMDYNKYIDVEYDPSTNTNHVMSNGYFKVDDQYYYGNQTLCNVATSSLITTTHATSSYLNAMGAKIYATVCFTMKEANDGYQYIQILTDNSTSWDCSTQSTGESAGSLADPVLSIYKALFEMDNSTSANTNDHYMFFPHRYDSQSSSTEFVYSYSRLYSQKFKSHTPSYRAANSGSLVLAPTVNTINVRFDCAGKDNDTYWVKNLKIRMALCDNGNPTLADDVNGITVSAGPYVNGNTFYISVPFSEIVNTAKYNNNKKLVTSWGDATYYSGDGTNVITFQGTINANANTTLEITSLQCNFKDLMENSYQGSNPYTNNFNKTFTGVTCSNTYTLAATNTAFSGLNGDYWVSDNNHLPQPQPTVLFYKGIVNNTNQVSLTENTHYTLSWSNNTTMGTGTVTATGAGNYNGSASTTFPIRWGTYTVSFHENGSTAIPATGTMSNQNFQYGVAQNLTANAFSRTGFTFAGWNTQPDGSGASYNDEEAVTGLNPEDGGTTDLYAQWTPIPWTGSGNNANDPYVIIYASQLDLLSDNLRNGVSTYSGKFFRLDADITYLHDTDWDDATSTEHNFNAIGISASNGNFQGTFDGNGKTISGIRIYMPYDECQGLFGYVSSGTVKNVTLRDARITGKQNSGGIIGYSASNTIDNCLAVNVAFKITENKVAVGIILGNDSNHTSTLTDNHYLNCSLTKYDGSTRTTRIGTISQDTDGARSVHSISLGANITASGENVVVDNVTYYASNTTITLGYTGGTLNTGYNLAFTYNDGSDHAIRYNSFTMPAANVTVSASVDDVWGIGDGATGSSSLPYMITTPAGLDLLAKNVNGTHSYTANSFYNKHFKLGDDITYSTKGLGENESNYTAIGSYDHKFEGIFDGNGKTISGIRINSTDAQQGLFGCISSATIKGVILANSIISGGNRVGGIVGYSFGTVENCRVESSVTIKAGENSVVHYGGIVGDNRSNVFGCISAANVSDNGKSNCRNFGGIVGYCYDSSKIKDCLYTGTSVTANSYNGAILGHLNAGTLTNNYYTTDNLGGVGGSNSGSDRDGARRAYVITLDEGIALEGDQTTYDVSGLTAIGTTALSHNDGTTTTLYSGATQSVTLSYTGMPTTGYALSSFVATNGGAISGNTLTMPASDVTVSATFTDVWGVTNTPAANGTKAHPYLITNTAGLDLLAMMVNRGFDTYNKFFKLGADIEYDPNTLTNGENYTTIGGYHNNMSCPFKGTFDGDGHTISGIRIHKDGSEPANYNQGIFGYTWGSTIMNVTLSDADITGYLCIGGIAGYSMGSHFTNCHVTNTVAIHAVQNNAMDFGGIVGYSESIGGVESSISGCTSAVTLTVADGLTNCVYFGGIAGFPLGSISDYLVTGATIPTLIENGQDYSGAITGYRRSIDFYGHNYYNGVTIGNATTGIGIGFENGISQRHDLSMSEGAMPAYRLTLGEHIVAMPEAGVTYQGSGYYQAGTTITLNAEGYTVDGGYIVNGAHIEGNTFTMPASDVTVSATLNVKPWAGNGTQESPYVIMYRSQLDLLAERLNSGTGDDYAASLYDGKFFKLGADIHYPHTTAWNDTTSTENNFTAIGSNNHCFRGTFDGDGHTISGIRIYKGADEKQGLFSDGTGGTIKNLTLTDTRITGKQYVGGIAGYTTKIDDKGGIIENCHVTGSVAIHAVADYSYNHGGIAGRVNGGSVIGCTSAATLTMAHGTSDCNRYGGIAGYFNGDLQNCLVVGANVSGSEEVGAIVGYPEITLSSLSHNYYYNCTLKGTASGDITANDGAVPCYALTLPSGLTTSGNTILNYQGSRYVAAGQTVTLTRVYEGYTISSITVTKDGIYPEQTVEVTNNSFTMPEADVTVTVDWNDLSTLWSGAGTSDNPYIITNCAQLDALAFMVNQGNTYDAIFFRLDADICYPYTTAWDDVNSTENNYTAIGINNHVFQGTFDGNGHTVSGIRIYKGGNTSDDSYQGLFGLNNISCNIKNITLSDSRITGYNSVGGIAGENYGYITNCHVTNNVAIHAVVNNVESHGGIAGKSGNGVSILCTSSATLSVADSVSDCRYFGGIEGYGGYFYNCLALGVEISDVADESGALIGFKFSDPSYSYYHNCRWRGATTGIGTGKGDQSVSTVWPAEEVCITIPGYGDGNGRWAFIASPLNYYPTPHHVQGLITTPAEHYDLYRFNQNAEGAEWQNYKAHNGTLPSSNTLDFLLMNGEGYLFASKDTVTLSFLGIPHKDNTGTAGLYYTSGKPMAGWNLIGNPLATPAYIDRPYYKMNAGGTGVEIVENYAETPIPACTGVVVKTTKDETVTFSKTAPEVATGNNGSLQMTLSQQTVARGEAKTETVDKAIVSFNEGSQLGKFYFGEQDANIYIPQNGEEYALVYSEKHGEVPVNFKVKKNGEYTLTVSSPLTSHLSSLTLIDNLTGANIDLLQTPSYTFTARKDDYASRFKLVFDANDNENQNEDFAFISDGEIIVNGEGTLQVIDLLGRQLYYREANSEFRIPHSAFPAGVYVLRLVNGDNIKTQKIVIK